MSEATEMNWRNCCGLFLAASVVLAGPGARAQRGTAPGGADSPLVDLTRATIVTPSTLTVPERTAVPGPGRRNRKAHDGPIAGGVTNGRPIRCPSSGSGHWQRLQAGRRPDCATPHPPLRPELRGIESSSAPPGVPLQQCWFWEPTREESCSAQAGCCANCGLTRGSVRVPATFSILSTPQVALRGHQLGYRPRRIPTTRGTFRSGSDNPQPRGFRHQCDRADPSSVGRRARQSALPASSAPNDDEMSQIAAGYGQDVWVWYPAIDDDYADPRQVDTALGEWADVLSKLPRMEAVRAGRRSRSH